MAFQFFPSERNRFSCPRRPRMTAGITVSPLPAKTIGYSPVASGNSTASKGTELTVLLKL